MTSRGTTVIVAGGAGYIGSHMSRMLSQRGYDTVVVDNLATGHADAVHGLFEQGDIGDAAFISDVLRRHRPACVMHFAAFSIVADSMARPDAYRHNNVEKTRVLLDAMLAQGVNRFIFSSTAAVYGTPSAVPVREDHPCRPINPYGETKLAVEAMLRQLDGAHGLRSVSLRYFNAAGAHPDGTLGERHDPETHLIPLVLQVAAGRRAFVSRFGMSHATPDGSCIRDYVHVQDLCEAHLLAMERLAAGGASAVYNLGNGTGHSVTEVIEAARRVTGHPIPLRDEPPRAGDPPVLVADASRARAELGWQPLRAGIDTMIEDAWRFYRHRQERARGGAAGSKSV